MWVCHVSKPRPRQELTQILLEIQDVVATSGIVKLENLAEEEESKRKIPKIA